jgi:hypothetical protein
MSPSVVADYDTDDAELQGDLKAEVKGDVMIKNFRTSSRHSEA